MVLPPEEMKTCSKCKQVRHLNEFSSDSSKKDSKRSHCKHCDRLRWLNYKATHYEIIKVVDRAYQKSERGKKTKTKYWQSERGKQLKRSYDKNNRKQYPRRHKARAAINTAVRYGQLPRVTTLDCQNCGNPAQEYHHYKGYKREYWLTVIPLCQKCHQINDTL
jgi:hypothetical protein